MTEISNRPSAAEIQLGKVWTSARNLFGLLMTGVTGLFAVIAVIPLAAIVINVASQGLLRINLDLFTKLPPPPGLGGGGLGNAIVGTLIVLAVAMAISVPIGVLGAVWLSEFGRGSKIAYWVRFSANVLSGVPAIIAGLFSYTIVVMTMGTFSAFAGGVALAVVMLPIVMRTTEEGLVLVPEEVRLAALGLGATRFETVSRVVLPAALPSIATAVTLAVARAGGEAAPLLFTALNNNFWSTDLFRPISTLSVQVYFFAIIPYKPQQELAWAGALVLLSIILLVSIVSRLLTRKKRY
ncbi:phosphate ABC transporter permease PstA [Thermosynechococcus sp. QKsg1]|uniref:phosphate ABC transporter permease PstA n=1 Tax=unclassified Thermosynechococcus TaxID=2622553 RepID=UPI00122DDF21|nr:MULTISPECIES: phosphate ABC transporter permease PstA [unclassified Thermosynechococcus]QEP99929.1 phosphate ABC transporter permease PstA [Thermosynechococcus sp. CL-1]WJI24121.1 phosphate ABC transporter permease PstA [Thermosynechococcus sp. B0]WJI26634.1 phosphate ABC transporter permease PstA [Thermosynechococcus sp. B1]WJI29161.1 phosphate ABC transporter permease PstA [Thermosynechococcus sp. B3]WKT83752.1 phosphate ABC transporter permease PstA [Thermosynechococcus sp. HY596]